MRTMPSTTENSVWTRRWTKRAGSETVGMGCIVASGIDAGVAGERVLPTSLAAG